MAFELSNALAWVAALGAMILPKNPKKHSGHLGQSKRILQCHSKINHDLRLNEPTTPIKNKPQALPSMVVLGACRFRYIDQ
jgi:hypothetical protein